MQTKVKTSVREIAISKFKAKCLSLLEEVSKTKIPIRVTRRGKAIADVIPASPAPGKGIGSAPCPVESKSPAT
jgi:prevent-host-death family protein